VMGDFFQRVTGKTWEAAGITRNWGEYIKALRNAGTDSKVTVFLDHIRSQYRNPQTHPDEQIPIEEAQRLFPVALSSIEQMMLVASRLPPIPVPPAPSLPAAPAPI